MKTYAMFMASVCGLLCAAGKDAQQQPVRQGQPLNDSYQAAYNLPAAIAVSHKIQHPYFVDWTYSVMAAVTYKYINEEGLRLAYNAANTGLASPLVSQAIFPDFSYQPGFKAGLQWIHKDQFVYDITYTWTHINDKTSFSAQGLSTALADGTTGTVGYVPSPWFLASTIDSAYGALNAAWSLTLNTLDLTVGRPFYRGKNVVLSPRGGLEFVFIEQSLLLTLTEDATFAPLDAQLNSVTTAKSWSVGPVCGGSAKHMLPYGFYATGGGSFGLAYTSYTTLTHSEDVSGSLSFPYQSSFGPETYHAVRPNANMDFGLGWSTYIVGNTCFFDMALTYEFSVYWAQNMLTKLVNDYYQLENLNSAPQDLFTQGLSVMFAVTF